MNSQGPDPYTLTSFDYVVGFFHRFPAAWILIGAVALLSLAVWITRFWLLYHHVIEGLKSAPLVTTAAATSGLVKLVGQAQPDDDSSSYVWRETEKLDTRSRGSLRKTGTFSVGPMLIRDSAGDCLVDPQEATVIPTLKNTKVDNHLFDSSTYRTEWLIRKGDPVVALGELRRPQPKPGQGSEPCRLRRSDHGVLLYSGKSEAATLLRFRLYFWPTLTAMIFCLTLAGFGFWAHLQGYPNQSVGEYVDALMTRPFTPYPGADR